MDSKYADGSFNPFLGFSDSVTELEQEIIKKVCRVSIPSSGFLIL